MVNRSFQAFVGAKIIVIEYQPVNIELPAFRAFSPRKILSRSLYRSLKPFAKVVVDFR